MSPMISRLTPLEMHPRFVSDLQRHSFVWPLRAVWQSPAYIGSEQTRKLLDVACQSVIAMVGSLLRLAT